MTRETARIIVEQLDNYLSHTCQDYGDSDHEAMMMAIEALEQESVLDKIRAEIEQTAFKDVNGSKYIFINRVNQIIDKYKAESEES